MPRNDRSDSLSVRDADDPRQPVRALEQERELELGRSEAHETGGIEHQGPAEREGEARRPKPGERSPRPGDKE